MRSVVFCFFRIRGPIITAAFALALASSSLPAHASLQITPGSQEACVAPGRIATGSWLVRHDRRETVQVAVVAQSYAAYLANRRESGPCGLSLDTEIFLLPPGAGRPVSFRYTMPDSATGEHMFIVFFKEGMPGDDGSGSSFQGRIGLAVYIMAQGTLEPALHVASLRLVKDGEHGGRICLELTNPGNVHLRPRGEVVLYDAQGAPAARALLKAGFPVLPNGRELCTTDLLVPDLPRGTYTARWILGAGDVGGRLVPEMTGEAPITNP